MSVFGLLALLVLSLASVAQAADVKATGKWNVEAQWNSDLDFSGALNTSNSNVFHIEQRMRTAFQFIANENLKAVLDTQIGSQAWGSGMYSVGAGRTPNSPYIAAAVGSSTAAGQGNIMLRQGYIDYKWPGTKVNIKVGFQTLGLPAAFGGGSAILDDQIAAAVVSAPITDAVSIVAGYARPNDVNTYGSTAAVSGGGTATDAVFAAVPVTLNGFSIAPFAMYAYSGRQSNTATVGYANGSNPLGTGFAGNGWNGQAGARAYWAGVAFTMTAIDPIKLMADLNYGKANYDNTALGTNHANGGRVGWMGDIAVDYTGLSMMTPEVFFVYSSGEKNNGSSKDGRMPVVGNPQTWNVNNSLFFGDRNFITGFATSSTGSSYGGYYRNVEGFWTTGVSLKDIKLVDKLSHTFNILYAKGTNAHSYITTIKPTNYGAMLSDKDHLWEFDLNNSYKIYDELTLNLDLNYINASFDKDTWRAVSTAYGTSSQNSSNAYRVAVGMAYAF